MPIRLTFEELRALQPCRPWQRKALWGRRKYLTAAQALAAGASVDDLLWVAGRLGRKDLCVRFALACAWRVAHLNPDPRVQAALDAAQAWLDNPSDATKAAAEGAGWVAKNAAGDAEAARAAGNAAWVAGLAARAAGNAAWVAAGLVAARAAARDAAWAASAASAWDAGAASVASARDAWAAWAAGDAERQAQRKLFLEIFGGV